MLGFAVGFTFLTVKQKNVIAMQRTGYLMYIV
jgi:hypothetical protein